MARRGRAARGDEGRSTHFELTDVFVDELGNFWFLRVNVKRWLEVLMWYNVESTERWFHTR